MLVIDALLASFLLYAGIGSFIKAAFKHKSGMLIWISEFFTVVWWRYRSSVVQWILTPVLFGLCLYFTITYELWISYWVTLVTFIMLLNVIVVSFDQRSNNNV